MNLDLVISDKLNLWTETKFWLVAILTSKYEDLNPEFTLHIRVNIFALLRHTVLHVNLSVLQLILELENWFAEFQINKACWWNFLNFVSKSALLADLSALRLIWKALF